MKLLKMLLFSTLLFLFIGSVFAVDAISLKVGESQNRKLYVYNPSTALTDVLDVTISTTGKVNSWVTNTQENRLEVEVLPRENKSIPVTIIATDCTQGVCEGVVNFLAVSQVTGNAVEKEVIVTVEQEIPRRFIGRAPGLSWVYFVLIGVFGSLIISKKLKFRS